MFQLGLHFAHSPIKPHWKQNTKTWNVIQQQKKYVHEH